MRLKKHCKNCPAACETDEAEFAINVGCLPDFFDMFKWYQETGKVWACHDKNLCQCQGFVEMAKDYKKIDIPENTPLITEDHTLEEIYAIN